MAEHRSVRHDWSKPADPKKITEPGVFDVSPDEYHSDPVAGGSLSSSEARALLPPSCPAVYRWTKDHGQAPKRTFDLGHAAHSLVLGAGADIEVIDAPDWRTKAAKEQRDAARDAGLTPLLAHEAEQVKLMAAAIRRHPVAAALLNPAGGAAEQTIVWRDGHTGVWSRARYDWLPTVVEGRRLIISDYKTCVSADPEDLAKAMHRFGYHQQAQWYLDGAKAVLQVDDPAFVFIAQEKTPPYVVTIFEPDSTAMRIAQALNTRARQVWQHCTQTGRWPAYTDEIALLALPRWAEIQEGEA